jgi:hypothetical protein
VPSFPSKYIGGTSCDQQFGQLRQKMTNAEAAENSNRCRFQNDLFIHNDITTAEQQLVRDRIPFVADVVRNSSHPPKRCHNIKRPLYYVSRHFGKSKTSIIKHQKELL